MLFVLMSNKNLLLPKYYVQSSVNYIINITENISALIVERLCVCLVCGSSGVQNPGPVKSNTVQRYKRFVTVLQHLR